METSALKTYKTHNSLEPIIKTLLNRISPCKKPEIYLNQERLDLIKVKEPKVRRIRFIQVCETNADSIMNRLAKTIKATHRPEKLDIILKQQCWKLTDEGFRSICEGFRRQTSLKEISLEFLERDYDEEDNRQLFPEGKLTDIGMKSVAKSLKNLTSLQKLTLKFGLGKNDGSPNFSDQGMKYLSHALRSLPSLKSVQISLFQIKSLIHATEHNKVTDVGLQYLSNSLKHLTSLQKIHLNLNYCCKFTDQGIKAFSQNLEALRSLESIELGFQSWNSHLISDEGLERLSQCFTKHPSLTNLGLNFSGDSLTDQGLRFLGENLKRIPSLQNLRLGFQYCQNITDEGVKDFSEHLETLRSLETLELSVPFCYNISNQGLGSLSESFPKYPSLKNLGLDFLSGSKISDLGLEYLGQSLKRITSLQSISLNFNQSCAGERDETCEICEFAESCDRCGKISDIGVVDLCQGLKKLTSLKSMSLSFKMCSNLTNTSLKLLADVLLKLSSLENLALDFSLSEFNPDYDSDYKRKDLPHPITNKGMRYLCNALEKISPSLKSLDLGFAGKAGVERELTKPLIRTLKKLSSLQSLSLNFAKANRRDEDIQQLSESLKHLISLESVTLDFLPTIKSYVRHVISKESQVQLQQVLDHLPRMKEMDLTFDET